jgi:hypothetical protein
MGCSLYVVPGKKATFGEEGHLRLSWSAMGDINEWMNDRGMLYCQYSDDDLPPYPTLEQFGLGDEPVRVWSGPDWESDTDPHNKALSAYRRWRPSRENGEPQPGIAAHKLSSNEAWWVTMEECRQALAAYERHAERSGVKSLGEEPAFWREWLKFLELAAREEGFELW